MATVVQLFGADALVIRIREMRTYMDVALHVAECHSAAERRHDAETIVRLVMGNDIAGLDLQHIESRLAGTLLSPILAACLTFIAARLLIDQKADGSARLMAKLDVNKMEKRLIAFVKKGGVQPWPHSCEFIVGPYASAAQFAQVQARYAATHLGRLSPVDLDPDGFAGA